MDSNSHYPPIRNPWTLRGQPNLRVVAGGEAFLKNAMQKETTSHRPMRENVIFQESFKSVLITIIKLLIDSCMSHEVYIIWKRWGLNNSPHPSVVCLSFYPITIVQNCFSFFANITYYTKVDTFRSKPIWYLSWALSSVCVFIRSWNGGIITIISFNRTYDL